MNEKLLAFIWQNRLYDSSALLTTQGEQLQVLRPGYINTMSGPDVTDAQVKVGSVLWTGNVEFHVKSSHWQTHHHDSDPAYSNIILHVVFEDDKPLSDCYGNLVPTLVIKFSQEYIDRHNLLISQADPHLCPAGIYQMSSFNSLQFTSRLAIERLEQKAAQVRKSLQSNRGDWTETFWQYLARTFGFGKNSLPFELMAKSLPYNIIIKNSASFASVLSLIMGQSGFLDSGKYRLSDLQRLSQEYRFLRAKYQIEPINIAAWKFSGIRPQNSPIARARQLASLVSGNIPLFSQMLESESLESMLSLLDFKGNSEIPPLGIDAKYLIIINLACPFLVCYSHCTDNYNYSELAVELLEKIPAEKNSLVQARRKAGFNVPSAYYSQALIQLDTEYCRSRKCAECQVGRHYICSAPKPR